MSSPERLREILLNKGTLAAGSPWERAVLEVPRALFLPDVVETPQRVISRSTASERWLSAVYGDLPLTTQVNDGRPVEQGAYELPTSSSSMPSVMVEMLDLLDLRDGQRVLELGAATGYNAAWLCHRLGDACVTTLDIDPMLAEQASVNLKAAGYSPRVVVGDGAAGWPDGAPYQRLIATYTVSEIPYAWVEQVPSGRIVAPWGGSWFSHSFAVLETADGIGQGRFSGYPAFMRSRSGRPHRGYLSDFLHHSDDATTTHTALSPRALVGDSDALFFTGLALPDAWYLLAEAEDGSDEATLWLLADDRASWAAAECVPGHDAFEVDQYGPRRLWDEAETAYRRWQEQGAPARDRLGLTVTPSGQSVWLDTPEQTM
ncbi:methyltransferase domain-containing protein [Streptomyces sp. BPTC-684]|uniref:methyltransferase domain-containing protein n=1 Tax=Streptomyces sp. BPTC-684 TaxID=3043734 RepID=UPI0024B27499|nr:methyltransferase domain-containing protein [Streptomyces sp. BPTC-684]WHM40958.1 protein-L-isoaspartate(D-aspartate) O-methyltransferase [Streptomyces sp. BPTC-684]